MTEKSGAIRDAIVMAGKLDREWRTNPAGHDDTACAPWMPFPLFDFIALTAEALPDTTGDRFLEVGCGIGTRMMLARDIFGLDVTGIERVTEYANQAANLGMPVVIGDALEFVDYDEYDLIWNNRAFKDPGKQAQLEQRIYDGMHRGAVVMCANVENPPPSSWWIVLDDMEIRRGVWQKP